MKKKGTIIFAIAIISIFVSLYFDSQIVKAVSTIRIDLLDSIFLGITFLSSGVIIFFILTSLFLWKEHKRKWIIPLWITLGVSAVVGFILKITVQRLRPFQLGIVSALPALHEAMQTTWDFSFPSSHALIAFCALPILNKEFPRFKYLWIAFACLVAFSRVYLGVHFLSDVISGGLIGYLIGVVVVKLETENKIAKKILYKIFRR